MNLSIKNKLYKNRVPIFNKILTTHPIPELSNSFHFDKFPQNTG